MMSERSLSRPGILAAALLLLPLLSSFAPAAGAEVSFWDRPKIEIKAGPAVTEGEPMTFTLRVTPVQAVDLVVPVRIDGRGFINYTIPAGTRELPASVPTVDNEVDENDRSIGVTPYTGRTRPLRTRAGMSSGGWNPYIWITVKDNDPGDRPMLSFTSEAPKRPDSWNHTWVDEGDTVHFTIKAEDQIPKKSFQVCIHMRDSHYGNGNFLAHKDEGTKCVVFPAGQSSITFSLPTLDDDVPAREGYDDIVVTLLSGSGYYTSETLRYVRVYDNDQSCVATSADLVQEVRRFYEANRNRADRNHGENWLRVLIAFGAETHATLQPYTVAEARASEAIWSSGWRPVRKELERLEACGVITAGQQSEPAPQAPPTPEVSITAASGGTEGGDATFTLTATPAPASDLAVSVAVAATGDYGVSTGDRTVTIPTTGSATLTVATTDDTADEADGSVTATLNAGDGYTVGAPSSLTADILDNDDPPPAPALSCAATPDDLVGKVRGYYALNRDRADRNHGENWLRVLIAFGAETHATLAPYTSAEAQAGEAAWSGWTPVREELERLEACGASTAGQQSEPAPPTPEVSITAASGGTEGGDATFTLTATPAPAADLAVSVAVAAAGDYGVATGDRAVTIPTTGSATLTVATTDDAADEPDGSVTATLNAGDGYTVGAPSSLTADILDDDDPPPAQAQASAFAADAQLVSDIRRWRGETDQGQAHVDRWTRVLIALGAEAGSLAPMSSSEAQGYADNGWTRWERVVAELKRKEAHDAGQPSAAPAVEPAPQVPPTPEVSITGGAAVTEGGDAVFTLTAAPAPASDIEVSVTVSETGSFAAAGATGARAVTIGAGGTAEFAVATDDDAADEADGSIDAVVAAGEGYAVGGSASASVVVTDDDEAAPPPVLDDDEAAAAPLTVSVDDASAEEGSEASFKVRLSAPAPGRLYVFARTREATPVSAKEGVDYKRRLTVAIFDKGDTEDTVEVSTLQDVQNDSGETFEVVLFQPRPGRGESFEVALGDAVGVGTITNDDPLPGAYLARFGRALAEEALDGVAGRIDAEREPGMRGSLAGYALGFGAAPGRAADAASPAAVSGALDGAAFGFGARPAVSGGFGAGIGAPAGRSGAMGLRDVLAGSSFALTGAAGASGGSVALWGRSSRSRFEGREGAVSLGGEVSTGLLGADYARGGWLAGLALARSAGGGAYRDPSIAPLPGGAEAGAGDMEATLTAAVPYAAARLSERLSVWGAAGLGEGEVRLGTGAGESLSAGVVWRMAAAGLRGELLPGGGAAGLSLVSDALWTATDSESARGLSASEGFASRARAGLEGRYRLGLGGALGGGASLTPSLEVAARHDGGAESGFGVDAGGGLALSAPSLGLSLEVRGRALVAHADGAARRSGFSVSLAWDPRPASVLGWSLSLRREAGGPSGGGVDALFSGGPFAAGLGGPGATFAEGLEAARWTAEAGYGLAAFGGRFVGTPRLGYGRSPFGRDYSVGWRLSPDASVAGAPDLSLGLSATRREGGADGAEHGIGLDIALRW